MDPEMMVEEAECDNCHEWFEYVCKNLNYPRHVCPNCIAEWRKRYVG
jgi:predicted Zn-ribbon and HTH transcriptional regulator